MSVDLTPIASALMALAAAMVTAGIPFVVVFLKQRLNVAISADQQAALERALNAGAGVAYKFATGLIAQGGLNNVQVHNSALAVGAQYVTGKLPETLDTLGLTPDAVHEMVSARLGTLLASDPTVTAGVPAVPTPAVPVQPATGGTQ